jgi:hypothetical protein
VPCRRKELIGHFTDYFRDFKDGVIKFDNNYALRIKRRLI